MNFDDRCSISTWVHVTNIITIWPRIYYYHVASFSVLSEIKSMPINQTVINSYQVNYGMKELSHDTLHWNLQAHSIKNSMLSFKRCWRRDSGPHLHCDVCKHALYKPVIFRDREYHIARGPCPIYSAGNVNTIGVISIIYRVSLMKKTMACIIAIWSFLSIWLVRTASYNVKKERRQL